MKDEPKTIKVKANNNNKPINVNDISGTKSAQRLVFIININNKDYVLKIAPSQPQFIKEIAIYKELTKASNQDPELKNKIIKIYDGQEFNKGDNYQIMVESQKINFDENNNAQIYHKIVQLFEANNQYNSMVYSVLEYDNNYKTLLSALDKIQDKCSLIFDVLSTVNFLNNKYGFIHFDLHLENVLIYPTNEKVLFKLFDFDLSTTKANPNKQFAKLGLMFDWEKFKLDNITDQELVDIGIIYDFYRFTERLMYKIKSIPSCSNNMEDLLKLYTKNPIEEDAHEGAADDNVTTDYFMYLFISVLELYKKKEYQSVRDSLNINKTVIQTAGYYKYKYQKYKNKYMQLRNEMNL